MTEPISVPSNRPAEAQKPKLKIAVNGGTGRVGSVIAKTLAPFYDVTAGDTVEPSGQFAVINAAPYHTSVPLALAAIEAGVHYLDMTEDVEVLAKLRVMASEAEIAVIPQCGLAPGVVSIIAGGFAERYEKLKTLNIRVGGLPRFPVNSLGYAITWNVEGLLNQYTKSATAIRKGTVVQVPALGDVEELRYDGVLHEAFNTSGGVGTLCETFSTADEIDYKTIRYPGHAKLMKFLMQELDIDTNQLRGIIERAIPATDQDVVLIAINSTGWRNGRLEQATYSKQVFGVPGRSALQAVTGTSVCAVLDLLATGVLKRTGFVKQEEIPLLDFMRNRYGKVFA